MFRPLLCRRVRLLGSSVVRNRRAFSQFIVADRSGSVDITGFHISISDPATATLYNESLTNFLTHENDPATSLRVIRETDKNIGMVNALLTFQMIRQPKPSNHNERAEVEELLQQLESDLSGGDLISQGSAFMCCVSSLNCSEYLLNQFIFSFEFVFIMIYR